MAISSLKVKCSFNITAIFFQKLVFFFLYILEAANNAGLNFSCLNKPKNDIKHCNTRFEQLTSTLFITTLPLGHQNSFNYRNSQKAFSPYVTTTIFMKSCGFLYRLHLFLDKHYDAVDQHLSGEPEQLSFLQPDSSNHHNQC